MTIKNSYKLLVIALVALLAYFIWNGSEGSESNYKTNASAAKNEAKVINVNKSFDYATSGDIEGLVNYADYVVSGHYEKLEKQWDMGGGYVSDVYSFVIDESLNGDLKDTISVAIPQYVTLYADVEGQSYSANLDLPNKTTPTSTSKYILFLKKYEPANIYTPAAVPFQVEISSTGQTALIYNKKISTLKKVETAQKTVVHFNLDNPNDGLVDEISGLSEKEILSEITNAVSQK
ncbi:hypothetical protein [Cohnella sp. AR92]|uniref:hypothetical protein n=1 Tax=Cohnella sp. AR92 TaxID=648716 RepID=UPI000F8C44BC|nr:hypothetical protein [Cohnella sp. AR92]RUS43575.1 hypothetical protein ELR57_24925 [Cohnella sp. AR92]